jgi:nicotinate dehydrogenase subunit B
MRDDELPRLDFTELSDVFAGDSSTDRREFLKVLGGGIFVFVALREAEVLGQRGGRRGFGQSFGQRLPSDFNAFLRIGEDGRVSCFTGKIEMGQGIITSLAQMLADELNVPLDEVEMVMGDTDLCPWDMGTFGSMSTRFFGPPLRAAAAEARGVLLDLAAERLQTPVERLKAEGGFIFDEQQNARRVSYAALTQGKRIERHLDREGMLIKRSPARRSTRPTSACPACFTPRSCGLPYTAPPRKAWTPPRRRGSRACAS